MNSAQLCQTQAWKIFKNDLWKKLYRMENDYHWMDTESWIEAGRPEKPHPMEGGVLIKCAYCGWHGKGTSDRYLVLEHVNPVFAFPELCLDERNIVIACNHCNEFKGGIILHGTVAEIVSKWRKEIKDAKFKPKRRTIRAREMRG